MQGISASLPLNTDPDGGHLLLKSLKEVATQNLKMIVLTEPGERMMDPLFGAGVRRLLFENPGPNIDAARSRIMQQTSKYLPWVAIDNINITTSDNLLSLIIYYSIPKLAITREVLSITVN